MLILKMPRLQYCDHQGLCFIASQWWAVQCTYYPVYILKPFLESPHAHESWDLTSLWLGSHDAPQGITACLSPGGTEVKASACNEGDLGLIPGSGRPPGEGNGNPFQYPCLENPMDRGLEATVHRVAKSRTLLSDFTLSPWQDPPTEQVQTHPKTLGWMYFPSLQFLSFRALRAVKSDAEPLP